MSARYSLNRKDRKLAGVCSTIGAIFNIDPTFIRIGFAAFALMISWEMALIAYVAAGIYFYVQKRRAASSEPLSDFERMGRSGQGRGSIHD
ncbi:MAG: PspC domain-containing protein, partial [Sphingomicrobium sp.]